MDDADAKIFISSEYKYKIDNYNQRERSFSIIY